MSRFGSDGIKCKPVCLFSIPSATTGTNTNKSEIAIPMPCHIVKQPAFAAFGDKIPNCSSASFSYSARERLQAAHLARINGLRSEPPLYSLW